MTNITDSTQSQALRNTTIKILEDWAMMLVDELPASELETPSDHARYVSSVSFKGATPGKLTLLADERFVVALARNVMGVDEETTPSQAEMTDAFGELANVLAGNFITEAFGDGIVFDLTVPQVTPAEQHHSSTCKPDLTLSADDCIISVHVDLL